MSFTPKNGAKYPDEDTPEKTLHRVFHEYEIEDWHVKLLGLIQWVQVGNWFIRGRAQFDGNDIYFPKAFERDWCSEHYSQQARACLKLPKLEIRKGLIARPVQESLNAYMGG